MAVIEVKNLKKSFANVEAVKGLSFEVKEGEIFGLLGPNGAGKTTTLEILEGLKDPDSGEVKIFNHDGNSASARDKIGIVLQQSGFFEYLTIEELLRLFASFYKKTVPLADLIEQFELGKILHSRYHELSGGQKQRFVLAIALIHQPKLLFLDEPTIGLDPQVRQKFWDIIINLQENGMTIILTTHYMEEAEILCDRVAIIDKGKIIASDRPVKLINSLGIVSRIKFMSSKPINVAELEDLSGVLNARRDRYTYDRQARGSIAGAARMGKTVQWQDF